MVDQFQYDVFISYRQREPDKGWVRQKLVPALKQAGLAVCTDYECFDLGKYLVKEMERAVSSSRYTLAVVSPAYLESTFVEFENMLAEHLGLVKRERRLIVVMREPCEPRLGMQARLSLDMSNDEEFALALDKLVQTLKRPPDL